MRVLVVVEDDPDVQFLVETVFSKDDRFSVAVVAASAEDALEVARTTEPGIIVLDHGLAGALTGLEARAATQGGGPQRQDHPLHSTCRAPPLRCRRAHHRCVPAQN